MNCSGTGGSKAWTTTASALASLVSIFSGLFRRWAFTIELASGRQSRAFPSSKLPSEELELQMKHMFNLQPSCPDDCWNCTFAGNFSIFLLLWGVIMARRNGLTLWVPNAESAWKNKNTLYLQLFFKCIQKAWKRVTCNQSVTIIIIIVVIIIIIIITIIHQ